MKTSSQIRKEIDDKNEYLRREFGQTDSWINPSAPLEVVNNYLDNVIAFEENARREKRGRWN